MARPLVSVVLAAGLLVAAALPYFDLHRGQAGVESLPASDVKTAYELLSRDFPAGLLAPVEVVIDGAAHRRRSRPGSTGWSRRSGRTRSSARPSRRSGTRAGDLALLARPAHRSTPVRQQAPAAVATLRDD